jgi:glycosyltransferase involved in cell wall biosynthesis
MPERPDILMLALNYPPERTGIAPYTGALAAGLSKIGDQVTVRAAHPHYPEWRLREGYGQWKRVEQLDGVEVRRLRHYVPHTPRGIRRLTSELTFGGSLLLTRWGRPRLVIAVSPALFSTALAVLRLRVTPRRPRLVVWVQDIYTLGLAEIGEGRGLTQRVTRWVESQTLCAADRVVVIHQCFKDFLVQELGVAESKVVVVRNWTHLALSDQVDSCSAKAKLNWPANVTVAVHTGNMGAKQGLENIVDAARIADNQSAPVYFVLVGDGGERRALEKRARGISCLAFVDPLAEEEYEWALSAADVLLVNEKPGVAAMAVPSKLTSYFAAGRPVVAATDPIGVTASEVRASEAGVIVPAGDPGALLHAILAVGADAEAATQLGLNGRRYRLSVLDQEAAIKKWSDLVEDTIDPIQHPKSEASKPQISRDH